MRIIDGKKYYTAKEIGMLVGRTHLTIHLWDKWSNELEERGDKRLIPNPLKIGKQQTRYWNEDYVPEIIEFANNIKRGDLAEFSRKKDTRLNNEKKKKIDFKNKILKIEKETGLTNKEKLLYVSLLLYRDENDEIKVNYLDVTKILNINELEYSEIVKKLIDSGYITEEKGKYLLN